MFRRCKVNGIERAKITFVKTSSPSHYGWRQRDDPNSVQHFACSVEIHWSTAFCGAWQFDFDNDR